MAEVSKSLDVDVPVSAAYDQWSKFESFPIFMEAITQVEQRSEDEVFFRTQAEGFDRAWRAKIVKNEPEEEIRWVSMEGPRTEGRVLFESLGADRTRVVFKMEYEPEDWKQRLGQMVGMVDRQVQEDLDRFKRFIERKEQSGGRR
jgi:uncharacterized membrane protein